MEGEKAHPAFAKDLYPLAAARRFTPALEIAGSQGDVIAHEEGSDSPLSYLHPDWAQALASAASTARIS